MPRLASLVLLALSVVAMLAQSSAQLTAQCSITETQVQAAGTNVNPFTVTAGMILAEADAISGPKTGSSEVTSLSVTLADFGRCTGATPKTVTIQLGLYSVSAAGIANLVAQTEATSVSAGQLSTGNGGAALKLPVVLPNGQSPIVTGFTSQTFYIAVGITGGSVCLYGAANGAGSIVAGQTYSGTSLPLTITDVGSSNEFQGSAYTCPTGDIKGDPVFTSFHGQQFMVKGEAGKVFNLISSPTLQFNNRFVSLQTEAESMTAAAMKEVRAQFSKQSKMAALVKGSSRPPVTTAWSHAGTYLGESGIKLGESQLYVAPGAYATGFSTITLDGKDLPISNTPLELDGDMTITHSSAFRVTISTPSVRFTLVNSDNFINIEHARVLSSDNQLTGLLGQTADAEWEVVESAEFTKHIENDYLVSSNQLF